jgi:hypothetical protein
MFLMPYTTKQKLLRTHSNGRQRGTKSKLNLTSEHRVAQVVCIGHWIKRDGKMAQVEHGALVFQGFVSPSQRLADTCICRGHIPPRNLSALVGGPERTASFREYIYFWPSVGTQTNHAPVTPPLNPGRKVTVSSILGQVGRKSRMTMAARPAGTTVSRAPVTRLIPGYGLQVSASRRASWVQPSEPGQIPEHNQII